MPLIGTGKHKFPEDFVLRVMKEEFEKFSSMFPSSKLKEIKLIRYDPTGRQTTVQIPPVSGEYIESLLHPKIELFEGKLVPKVNWKYILHVKPFST